MFAAKLAAKLEKMIFLTFQAKKNRNAKTFSW